MKSIFKSKAFWLNLVAIINELIKFIPALSSTVPTVPTELVALGLPPANILVRKFTKESVRVLPEKQS